MALDKVTTKVIADDAVTGAKIENNPTVAGNLTVTGDVIPSTPLSHRNMVINGAMNVAQRASSGTGVGYTCADRFQRVADNNAGVTTSRVSEAPVGFENSYKVTITTADTSITSTQYEFHEQQIEGNNIYHLEWGTSDAKTVTLSFYVKSSLAGVFGGSIRNSANNRAYSFEYTINSAATWERKTITIAGDTTGTWLKSNLAGLKIEWALGSGSSFHGSAGWSAGHFLTKDVARSNDSADALLATVNATWQITGVQLELGSNATPYEHKSYGDELRSCQRYYFKITNETGGENSFGIGVMDGTTACQWYTNFPVTMRIAPTAIETSGTAGDYSLRTTHTVTCSGVPAHYHCTKQSAAGSAGVSSGTHFITKGAAVLRAVDNDAYLAWSAEL